jgi:uncharacterized protein YjdB
MKKTFLRILPLAAAVLLATSCSKDENNDNAVVNNGQETVQTKTLPISITVNQKGLSKLSCTGDMGADLQPIFEAGDKLAIYKGETFVKNLEVTADKISADGKTATFEGEIEAEGLVDGVTELTAKIGTPITAAVTATSRENAVKSGCYQTATFTYSSTGNNITLEEQNAYIEVVWTNKGNSTVDFTIVGGNTVSLTLNAQGQGWIVAPAGVTLECEALGIAEATTVKGNIYGITRTFRSITLNKTTATIGMGETETLTATTVPEGLTLTWASSNDNVATVENGVVTGVAVGTVTITATATDGSGTTQTCTVRVNNVPEGYVDFGIDAGGKQVYFEKSESYTTNKWTVLDEENKLGDLPTQDEWKALKEQCYWVWDGAESHKGYYVYKVHDPNDAGKITNTRTTHNPTIAYSTANDQYIFLPVPDVFGGSYWSSETMSFGDGNDAIVLDLGNDHVSTNVTLPKTEALPVVKVSRSSN